LPAVVRANARRAWEEEGAALVAVQKYACALEFLTDQRTPDDPLEGALALAGYLADLNRSLSLPGLAHYGVTRADFPRIVAGSRGSSMKTNPVELSDDELTAILEESL
jgi:alcohol dehydrogenase